MRAWTRMLGPVGPLALLAGPASAAGEPPPEPLDAGFLEFLAEEAGVDDELSEALMTADLDRAIGKPAERREGQDDDEE